MEPNITDAVKNAVAPVMTAFEEFKATNDARLAEIEKKGSADTLTEQKLTKIEATLSSFEGLNQRITLAEQQAKAAKEAADSVETTLARLPTGRKSADPIEFKARVNNWARAVVHAHALGVHNLGQSEQKILADIAAEAKALSVGTDTAGGYLAPTEYVREIIKGVTEVSPMRALARVRQTANKAVDIPKRTGQFSAQWVHEVGTKTETTGLSYGLEELTVHEIFALVDISNQMLEDSAFDMESEIRVESTEQFSVAEGLAFISGSGVGKPEGILVNTSVQETVSGAATAITGDGLLTLKHDIKTAYARNASWIMNRKSIGSVRKLKGTDGHYLWVPGIANSAPNTIDGDTYVEMPDMPSEGAGTYPVAYGDFRRGYTIADRIAMEMLRDPYTQAPGGNIRFIFRRRIGGKVTLAEAFRKMKCSA